MSLEKERIEKEHIEEMNQAKLRFFTNVSHEFRTPLTLIISQVELMLQKNTIPPSLHNSIFRIRKHAQQMKLLISELLDFRKFDQNYIQLKLSEQSLNTFLEEVYLSFSAYASQKSISYHLKLLEQDISIWIDDWQMRKVLFNLLSNAFKHVPDKGEISILTSTTPDQVVIAVKDSGNGISKEEQERIFDRFYQADNRNKALHVGTGIGLALTKSIIQLHHGTIEVESELNEGSCFIVKLPKNRDCFEKDTEVVFLESPEKEPMVQENTIPDENFMKKDDSTFETPLIDEREGKRKVLLVEDNVELLQVLKEIFSSLYQVVTAANGEEGLKQAFAEVPDLIVSDVMMPVMTGTEMCLKIKNNINLCHIPVVLLTALDTVDQNIEGLRRGADDYITKPFGIMELLSRVKAVLRRSHVQKPEQQQVLSAHDLTIDLNQRTVVYLETEIVLTYKEFELLSYLVRNRGSAISRDRLLEQVWGFSYEGETRTVDAHVKTLRQKLEAAGCTNLIHTVRGYGYKIGG